MPKTKVEIEITKDNVITLLLKTLGDIKDKCASCDYDISKVSNLLEPFLYYVNNDDLTEEENKIGDMIRKYIFNLIYFYSDEKGGYDFICSVLEPMGGHLAKLSNGEWNHYALRNPLQYDRSKGERIAMVIHMIALSYHKISVEEIL